MYDGTPKTMIKYYKIMDIGYQILMKGVFIYDTHDVMFSDDVVYSEKFILLTPYPRPQAHKITLVKTKECAPQVSREMMIQKLKDLYNNNLFIYDENGDKI